MIDSWAWLDHFNQGETLVVSTETMTLSSMDIEAVSSPEAGQYLTSANLCRWIINFNQIQLGKQIGMGSYGLVYKGKWKGIDVAVKKFIKQKMSEKRLLEIRAEAAMLSELHHPHIVMFIGIHHFRFIDFVRVLTIELQALVWGHPISVS